MRGLCKLRLPKVTGLRSLVLDVNDAIRPRVDKDSLPVDHSVTIVAYPVLWRNIVIRNLSAWKNSSYRNIVTIFIGSMMLTNYIFVEAWALINPEQSFHSAGDATDDTADNGTHWAGGGISLSSTLRRAPWYTLYQYGKGR